MQPLWRPLLAHEAMFARQYFGVEQGDWLVRHVRLGVRRVGDTRRALCLNGGWMSFPRVCFVRQQLAQGLLLQHPQVAGLFAHELLHQLQRRQGLPVTRQALWLQCRMVMGWGDPYEYRRCASATGQLRVFWRAQVEQQAQMWQDHVQAQVAGQPNPCFALLERAVQQGRLRCGQRLA